MSTFTEKYSNDLKLQLTAIQKRIREAHPTLADAFVQRTDALRSSTLAAIEKIDSIRSSGRYTPESDRAERSLLVRGFFDSASKIEADTVGKLQAQRDAQRVKLTAKAPPSDPALALVQELRAQEARTLLRTLDPVALQARVKTTDSMDLLDILDGAPHGFEIAPRDLIAAARQRIHEQQHPEQGDLAQLQNAYSFALGAAKQTVLQASGLSEVEATYVPDTPAAPMPAYRVGSGQEVQL